MDAAPPVRSSPSRTIGNRVRRVRIIATAATPNPCRHRVPPHTRRRTASRAPSPSARHSRTGRDGKPRMPEAKAQNRQPHRPPPQRRRRQRRRRWRARSPSPDRSPMRDPDEHDADGRAGRRRTGRRRPPDRGAADPAQSAARLGSTATLGARRHQRVSGVGGSPNGRRARTRGRFGDADIPDRPRGRESWTRWQRRR